MQARWSHIFDLLNLIYPLRGGGDVSLNPNFRYVRCAPVQTTTGHVAICRTEKGMRNHAQECGELGVTFIWAILDLVLILYGVGQ